MRLRKRESPDDIIAESQRLQRDVSNEARLARVALTENGVARFPEHAGVRLQYASALGQTDKDRAASEALRAVSLDKACDPVLLTLAAILLLHLGEHAAARSCVERAASTEPTNVVIVNQLSVLGREIALAEGDYESWERFLKAAHEADPGHEDYALQLAAVIIATSDGARLPEALAVIERTLKTEPSGDPGCRESRAELEQQRKLYQALLDDPTGGQGSQRTG
jgi:tetratricopeptide (TPR) repeat protein